MLAQIKMKNKSLKFKVVIFSNIFLLYYVVFCNFTVSALIDGNYQSYSITQINSNTNSDTTTDSTSSSSSGTTNGENISKSKVADSSSSKTRTKIGSSLTSDFVASSETNSSNSGTNNASFMYQNGSNIASNTENSANDVKPKAEQKKATESIEKTNSESQEKSEKVGSTEQTTEEKKEEKKQTPEDLPPVESNEIDFPEVIAATNSEESEPTNYFAGIIAWVCILIGVAIVIFVMLKGKSNADVPIQNISGNKKRRKGKHLLPDDYYRDRY